LRSGRPLSGEHLGLVAAMRQTQPPFGTAPAPGDRGGPEPGARAGRPARPAVRSRVRAAWPAQRVRASSVPCPNRHRASCSTSCAAHRHATATGTSSPSATSGCGPRRSAPQAHAQGSAWARERDPRRESAVAARVRREAQRAVAERSGTRAQPWSGAIGTTTLPDLRPWAAVLEVRHRLERPGAGVIAAGEAICRSKDAVDDGAELPAPRTDATPRMRRTRRRPALPQGGARRTGGGRREPPRVRRSASGPPCERRVAARRPSGPVGRDGGRGRSLAEAVGVPGLRPRDPVALSGLALRRRTG